MQIRHYSKGKFYLIECPEGTTVVRCLAPTVPGEAGSRDQLVVPFRGEAIVIPADPPDLLPLLAESGQCALSLVGEPTPNVNLAGVVCPNCDEEDVSWLSVDDDSRVAHCDYCGLEFGTESQT
jgi:ribosomal protein S27E